VIRLRNPVRTEADAFHIVIGSAAVIAASVLVGALASPLVGVALVGGAVAGALIWEIATADPDRRRPLSEAMAHGRLNAGTGRRRVCVVANRTLGSDELRAELLRCHQDGSDVHFVVPILASRVHYIASDVDRELRDAGDRLRDALAWARAAGLQATGTVGDPNVALGAIEDELRRSGADEVIISTHPPKRSNWLETGIVARLRDELDIPVTHLVADVDTARTSARG
jgi:GABA permease